MVRLLMALADRRLRQGLFPPLAYTVPIWSSRTSIKENAASLKKFYAFMLEEGEIDVGDLQKLKETVNEELDVWLKAVDG